MAQNDPHGLGFDYEIPILTTTMEKVAQWARRLRTRFQLGLVGWIRGERPEQNLEILETVAHQLEQVATRQPVFQLWWVVGAIVEALREGGLETGVSIKRLMAPEMVESPSMSRWKTSSV